MTSADKFWDYSPEIRDDPRMVELVWNQRRELVELTARHAQHFIRLALEIKKELEVNDAE